MEPWVAYQATGDASEEKSRAAAEATGIKVVWKIVSSQNYSGALGESDTLSDEAVSQGGFATELLKRINVGRLVIESGSTVALEADIMLQYNGVINVMKHLNMLPGSPAPPAKERVYVRDTRRAMGKNRGFWRPIAQPGKMLYNDEEIAIVTDEFGRVIEEINAPVEGILLINKPSSFIDPLSDVLSYRYGAFIGLLSS